MACNGDYEENTINPCVSRPGLEPGTNSLKGCCSTIELPTLFCLN